jgi:hypothetical protein
MVTLDQNLAVNNIQAHVGDNVEIRCDIVGKPQPPVILWTRYAVNLAPLNIPNLKVFSDGSLYLTDVQLSFSGNYTCQAETNSAIKQVHILNVIVPPVVEVSPRFQWNPLNGIANIECRFENMEGSAIVEWLKNDETITPNIRTSIMNNGTRLQISDLVRSDTGAYACRVRNKEDTAVSQDVSSLLVQNDPIEEESSQKDKSKLWVFHGNGVTIYSEGCRGLLHEVDARDIIPLNGLPLCGRSENDPSVGRLCEWGPNPIQINDKVYISQPNTNRIIVFHAKQLNVVQMIATDPTPMEMWLIQSASESRIWVLCHGQPLSVSLRDKKDRDVFDAKDDSFSYKEVLEDPEYQWQSPSKEQQRHNRKTIQIVRIGDESINHSSLSQTNVIHIQPIEGHFDLVYDLFVPRDSSLQRQHSLNNNRYAYATHWDERTIIKIDMESFKYIKTVNLAECSPTDAVFTDYGLVIIQCQTPVTHQLNGQLILDQLTDSIISFSPHIKGHKSFLSPNQRFVVNIFQNETSSGITSTTVIVQEVSKNGKSTVTSSCLFSGFDLGKMFQVRLLLNRRSINLDFVFVVLASFPDLDCSLPFQV